MSDVPTIKVVVRKKQLLEDLNSLDGMMAEYSEFLHRGEGDESWEDDAISLLRSHHKFLSNTNVSLRVIDLVSAIMCELLEKLKVEELTVKLNPAAPGSAAADRSTMFGASVEEGVQIFEELIARVNGIARNAPIAMQEKIRYLLLSILNLLKCAVNNDREGVDNSMTQINLITSSRESQTLVREIALIARDIYNTLNSLSEGIPVIDTLTESTDGISEAAKKLKAVVAKLEEAAFGNLDYLETLTNHVRDDEEICERILAGLRKSQHILGELKAAHPEKSEQLAALQDKLGDQIGGGVIMLRTRLHENSETYLSLTANQGFQDLTGQTLKKTIHFIEDLELQLIQLLQKYKPLLEFSAEMAGVPTEAAEEEQGAAAAPESGVAQSQDDVDKMLADLGF